MKSLLCKIKGHHFVKQSKTILYEELKCKNCKQEFTTDGYGRVVKLNSFWRKNHLFIEKHFQKPKMNY